MLSGQSKARVLLACFKIVVQFKGNTFNSVFMNYQYRYLHCINIGNI